MHWPYKYNARLDRKAEIKTSPFMHQPPLVQNNVPICRTIEKPKTPCLTQCC